jgi:hypothetical protein
VHLLAFHLSAVTDSNDVELLLEALGDAGDCVGDEATRETVELSELGIFALQLCDEIAVFLRKNDPGRQRLAQLAFGTLHFHRVGRYLHGHALRDCDRFLANT